MDREFYRLRFLNRNILIPVFLTRNRLKGIDNSCTWCPSDIIFWTGRKTSASRQVFYLVSIKFVLDLGDLFLPGGSL